MLDEEKTPRERILEASLILFVDKGYFNTNIPDISKLSSCSVGSIYHHFLNKEEIASVLYSEGISEFREFLSSKLMREDGSTEKNLNLDIKQTISTLVNSFLEFSNNSEISLQHKAILLGLSTHKNTINFIIEQLKVITGFEKRVFIFEYISKRKIDLTHEQLQSISLIMNDVFNYYSCILFSTLDLSYDDKNKKLHFHPFQDYYDLV